MRYRKLDATGDAVFGGGQSAFYRDTPEAPAQAVQTRLALFEGEWFLDTTEGMPWQTKVLGSNTSATRDPAIRERILGTEGVSEIAAYSSSRDPDTRAFTVTATITTAYGETTVTTETT